MTFLPRDLGFRLINNAIPCKTCFCEILVTFDLLSYTPGPFTLRRSKSSIVERHTISRRFRRTAHTTREGCSIPRRRRWRPGAGGLARAEAVAHRRAGGGAVPAGLHLAVFGAAVPASGRPHVALLKAFHDAIPTLCQPPHNLLGSSSISLTSWSFWARGLFRRAL